jgi:hypothetical protein
MEKYYKDSNEIFELCDFNKIDENYLKLDD